jgi:hypothetical protein
MIEAQARADDIHPIRQKFLRIGGRYEGAGNVRRRLQLRYARPQTLKLPG